MSFADAGRKIVEGASAGLYEAGTIIMANSQILVPVDTGTLKRSGEVEMPELSDDGDSVSVTVGYGYGTAYPAKAEGEDPDGEHGYGWYVHQVAVRKSGHVVRHKPPTQAFFLKVPAEAMASAFPEIIEANIRAKVGG